METAFSRFLFLKFLFVTSFDIENQQSDDIFLSELYKISCEQISAPVAQKHIFLFFFVMIFEINLLDE